MTDYAIQLMRRMPSWFDHFGYVVPVLTTPISQIVTVDLVIYRQPAIVPDVIRTATDLFNIESWRILSVNVFDLADDCQVIRFSLIRPEQAR